MQNAGDQKMEMEELKKTAAKENAFLGERKKAIDVELREVSGRMFFSFSKTHPQNTLFTVFLGIFHIFNKNWLIYK